MQRNAEISVFPTSTVFIHDTWLPCSSQQWYELHTFWHEFDILWVFSWPGYLQRADRHVVRGVHLCRAPANAGQSPSLRKYRRFHDGFLFWGGYPHWGRCSRLSVMSYLSMRHAGSRTFVSWFELLPTFAGQKASKGSQVPYVPRRVYVMTR